MHWKTPFVDDLHQGLALLPGFLLFQAAPSRIGYSSIIMNYIGFICSTRSKLQHLDQADCAIDDGLHRRMPYSLRWRRRWTYTRCFTVAKFSQRIKFRGKTLDADTPPHPSGKQFDYLGIDEGGLGLRVGPAGKSWVLNMRRPGAKSSSRITIGKYPALGLQDARDKAEDRRSELRADKPAKGASSHGVASLTWGAAALEYANRKKLRPVTVAVYKDIIGRKPVADWGKKSVTQITKGFVHAELTKVTAPVMANRMRAFIVGVLRYVEMTRDGYVAPRFAPDTARRSASNSHPQRCRTGEAVDRAGRTGPTAGGAVQDADLARDASVGNVAYAVVGPSSAGRHVVGANGAHQLSAGSLCTCRSRQWRCCRVCRDGRRPTRCSLPTAATNRTDAFTIRRSAFPKLSA